MATDLIAAQPAAASNGATRMDRTMLGHAIRQGPVRKQLRRERFNPPSVLLVSTKRVTYKPPSDVKQSPSDSDALQR